MHQLLRELLNDMAHVISNSRLSTSRIPCRPARGNIQRRGRQAGHWNCWCTCTMSVESVPSANDCPVAALDHVDVYVRTLHRACEKVGGLARLARELQMRPNTV